MVCSRGMKTVGYDKKLSYSRNRLRIQTARLQRTKGIKQRVTRAHGRLSIHLSDTQCRLGEHSLTHENIPAMTEDYPKQLCLV
jgi:hypothetical protein